MSVFRWSDEFSLQIPSIDEQHRQLLGVLDALHHAVTVAADRDHLQGLLRRFSSLATYHFAYEEALFTAHDYPSADEHKQEHRDLVGRLRKLRGRLRAAEAVREDEFIGFLNEWLMLHILGSDRAYATHLQARGVL